MTQRSNEDTGRRNRQGLHQAQSYRLNPAGKDSQGCEQMWRSGWKEKEDLPSRLLLLLRTSEAICSVEKGREDMRWGHPPVAVCSVSLYRLFLPNSHLGSDLPLPGLCHCYSNWSWGVWLGGSSQKWQSPPLCVFDPCSLWKASRGSAEDQREGRTKTKLCCFWESGAPWGMRKHPHSVDRAAKGTQHRMGSPPTWEPEGYRCKWFSTSTWERLHPFEPP